MDRILTLGIESSCDETAVAVVENGRKILSNVILSQIDIHKLYGGVVPEIASRNHIEAIDVVASQALALARITLNEIDNIGVTYGAGLVGALLVGVSFAKGLAQASKIPLYAVNHIDGHICANYVTHKDLEPPFICLLTSGGHTSVIKVTGYNEYIHICSTVDDAVGEAFDKVARVLGLPYPGGPQIDRLAKSGVAEYPLPEVLLDNGNFSYSGLKTAVINTVHKLVQNGEEVNKANMAASFTQSALDGLVKRSVQVLEQEKMTKLVVAGGVAANSYLRERVAELSKIGYTTYMPDVKLCTDNAVMIASRAYFQYAEGLPCADLTLNAEPTLRLRGEITKKRR